MKLRNKKTGEIGNLVLNINPNRESYSVLSTENGNTICGNLVLADYNSLAELNEAWEDYEDDKFYILTADGRADFRFKTNDGYEENFKQIGNYFETKEEAEKAVEKLKALKRLKDKRFKFNGITPMEYFIRFTYDKPRQILDNQQHPEEAQQFNADLDLLFGGEDE